MKRQGHTAKRAESLLCDVFLALAALGSLTAREDPYCGEEREENATESIVDHTDGEWSSRKIEVAKVRGVSDSEGRGGQGEQSW